MDRQGDFQYQSNDNVELEICVNGIRIWRCNGLIDRRDGPAVEWPTGENEWYIAGRQIEEHEFKQLIKSPSNLLKYVKIVEHLTKQSQGLDPKPSPTKIKMREIDS